MKKLISIDYQEYISYQQKIDNLRNDISKYQLEIQKLKKEISFLKDSGDNVLVIVKDKDKPDVHEYKSSEKDTILVMVEENSKLRERYDDILRKKDNIENQKQLIILKYNEMENIYKTKIGKLENHIEYLENRTLLERVLNKKKNIKETIYIDYDKPEMIESGPIKTIYSEDDIKKLEMSVKKVKKPRGWHFKEEFIDSDGNVYHKGKLQPHLKGTKK